MSALTEMIHKLHKLTKKLVDFASHNLLLRRIKKLEDRMEHLVADVENRVLEIEAVAKQTSKGFIQMTRQFFQLQASGGILLVIAAVFALILANTPFYQFYDFFLNNIDFRIGFEGHGYEFDKEIKKSLLLWINDGLMALFFFLVGLEIKREIVEGQLADRKSALLPVLAAIGGIVAPAGIYWLINVDNGPGMYGWAIPAATDIAFALGVLSLVGRHAPLSLKILLTAIAIIDDIGAILIIAIFYSHGVTMFPLWFAGAALMGLVLLNLARVLKIAPYVLFGIILWGALLESGIHATLAGVISAMFIPLGSQRRPGHSPSKMLEHSLHPWIAFGVLPLFAFANAGVPLQGFGWDDLTDPVTLGIIFGLFIGKQLGVFSALFFTIKSGIAKMPAHTSWCQLYAISVLCGVGFTMSLFIGGLAFADIEMQAAVRVGVLVGSIASALLGYLILKQPQRNKVISQEI